MTFTSAGSRSAICPHTETLRTQTAWLERRGAATTPWGEFWLMWFHFISAGVSWLQHNLEGNNRCGVMWARWFRVSVLVSAHPSLCFPPFPLINMLLSPRPIRRAATAVPPGFESTLNSGQGLEGTDHSFCPSKGRLTNSTKVTVSRKNARAVV